MHIWRLVGYYMGVAPVFLTDDYKYSCDINRAILARQAGSSPENAALARSCVDFIEHIIPNKRWKGFAPIAIRFFLGDHYATMLGIKPSLSTLSLWSLLFTILHFILYSLGITDQKSRLMRALVKPLGKVVMNGLLLHAHDYKKVMFWIPPSLSGAWHLDGSAIIESKHRS
jgi:hypothetical protein